MYEKSSETEGKARIAFNLLSWLFHHWFVLGAILACGVAAGQALDKAKTLEETVREVSTIKADTQLTKETLARHDERFHAVQESQARQEAMLQALLQGQQRISQSSVQIRRQLASPLQVVPIESGK